MHGANYGRSFVIIRPSTSAFCSDFKFWCGLLALAALPRRPVRLLPTIGAHMNPPDPRRSTSAATYCCELKRTGWVQIGEGVGGHVFHRADDPAVIKVSDGDNCYLAFADYVVANPPKVACPDSGSCIDRVSGLSPTSSA